MKHTRNIYKPLVLALAVAGAVAAMPAAHAQTAAAQSAAASAASAPSATAQVRVRGFVTGSPETVGFTGTAVVSSQLANDPDFNLPQLIFTLDLSGVTGFGANSRAQYVITGPEIIQRRLAPSHAVEITFPFVVSGGDPLTTQTGLASFSLDVDQNTGFITQASGSVSTPTF
jgi:F0F1-type ATP synthase membrane subunit c/vacuolar-type H+-ATPase subunit K